ncbi:hypothetical protein D3C76_1298700 [compost metagenome]
MLRKSPKAVCTCTPTPRNMTPRVASRLQPPFPTMSSVAARRTLLFCVVFPKWRPLLTCRSLALWGLRSLASSRWKKSRRSKISATTLTVPNTLNGRRSAKATTPVTSVCSCLVYWVACRMARTPSRCAASTTSKASRARITRSTCGPMLRFPSRPTW